MSVRNIPLFERDGRPTPFLMAQWRRRGGYQPLNPRVSYLDADQTANPLFEALWAKAFPGRGGLPVDPLADADGRGTPAFWSVFG